MNNMKKFKHKFTKQQLEDFDAWMEDGNVIKMQDGYATQDAQYRNRLKDLDELKEYFYKEYLREYENGGSADDMTMIGRAIEYLTGTAIERDSIVDKGFKYEFRYKGKTIVTSIDSKLVRDTIYSNKKSLAGRYSDGGEAGFNDAGTSMVMYHEKQGNWLVPKGQVYLYLYDVEDSASKLGNEFDWVFYPLTSQMMAFQRGYIPPLKKIWTKKFQKEHKGSEHLLGVIKAFLIDKDGKQELYIDMMSVNPDKKKKGIMSYMIKDLRNSFNLSQEQVTFSELTKEGEKFVAKKTYEGGGGLDDFPKSFKLKLKRELAIINEYLTKAGGSEMTQQDAKSLNDHYKFEYHYQASDKALEISGGDGELLSVIEKRRLGEALMVFNYKLKMNNGGGVDENNYRISISENYKYIGEYPNPIGSINEAKTIFVQLATKYKRPQYLISVSRIATSTSGYEKINVDEWYNFAESFKDGGGVEEYINMDKMNPDKYEVVRNFNTLKSLAKMGFIELDEKTGLRYKNYEDKMRGNRVTNVRHDYIKSAISPYFEHNNKKYYIGYEKGLNFLKLYVLEDIYASGGIINDVFDVKDLKKYLVYKYAGFNYHYIIGDYKYEINEFNDQKGWALNTYKKYKDEWYLEDSYGYEGLTLRECKEMIVMDLRS